MRNHPLHIIGGTYQEYCLSPEWDQVFGSGGRAAIAAKGHCPNVILESYANEYIRARFEVSAHLHEISWSPRHFEVQPEFEYFHTLASPSINPSPFTCPQAEPIEVKAESVLRFGLLEGEAVVSAKKCVYDPQNTFAPHPFKTNGSNCDELAIVGNAQEVLTLGRACDLDTASANLATQGASVIVVKDGSRGAHVYVADQKQTIPAYFSQHVWTIGSGDVFAGIFAANWACGLSDAFEAADIASRAVAAFAESRNLPSPSQNDLKRFYRTPVSLKPGKAYIAAPFFNLKDLWMLDEARNALREVGLDYGSPYHDVAMGHADKVAPKDIALLEKCDRVFALLDGLDTGTVYELGYAASLGKPVYCFTQSSPPESLTMIAGNGARIYSDFGTAIFHTAWLS